MEDNIEKKVLAILPVKSDIAPLDREELIKLVDFYKNLVFDYVGKPLELDDLVDNIKSSFNCKESKDCKKLYGGHKDLVEEDMCSILKLPKSSEEEAYLKMIKEKELEENSDFIRPFDTFLYAREENDNLYLGAFGLKKDEAKPLTERDLVHKTDLIVIKYVEV